MHTKCITNTLLILSCVIAVSSLGIRKFVYQVDLSEHCRRRVMPSVFLGRHVVEANSQILHFSQLDVPYSCYISIRTESGSNIILVTQISAPRSREFKCDEDENQVLVYEFGETFGGYWGPIPDSILKDRNRPSSPIVYTLASSKAATETYEYEESYLSEEEDEDTDFEETSPATTSRAATQEGENEGDFVRVELPLMNVSGRFVETDSANEDRAFDFHENFDILYDVTRKPGEEYSTSIIPVAQVDVQMQPVDRRAGGGDANITDIGAGANATDIGVGVTPELRFQLDYDIADFTLDPRLTFSYALGRTAKVRNYLTKRRHSTKKDFRDKKLKVFFKDNIHSTLRQNTDWDEIKQLMKSLNKSSLVTNDMENESLRNNNVTNLLQKISNIEHNSSAYLATNWSVFKEMKTENFDITNIIYETTTKAFTFFSNNNDFLQIIDESSLHTNTPSETTTFKEKITSVKKRPVTEKFTDSTITDATTNQNIVEEILKITHTTKKVINSTMANNSSRTTTTKTTEDDFNVSVTTEEQVPISTKSTDTTQKQSTTTQTNASLENEVKTSVTKEIEQPHRKTLEVVPYDKDGLLVPPNIDMTSKKVTKVTTVNKTTVLHTTKKSNESRIKPSAGPMVNKKSFENVVKAAPVMAGKLATNAKPTNILPKKNPFQKRKKRSTTKSSRKKRYVSVIPIENARPHNLTQGPVKGTTQEPLYLFKDRQDFEELIEEQDSGIYGHMVLRYMRRYVGAVLFNLCKEHAEFNVYLFNASRIVLAINNFTLKRMTVVATPARTMVGSGGHCPDLYLECQIKGARVCVDTVTACDGVPNCGAWDIYDEDRLYCGANSDQHKNAYLTAVTFLAVMLTAAYTVYYWLRRCVPKVSDAFFIYTDGTENVLYLDTIMRSHNDDTASKMVPSFFYETDLDMKGMKLKPTLMDRIRRFFRKCCRRGDNYRDSTMAVAPTDSFLSRQMKLYNFNEVELKKMSATVGVQTGSSLDTCVKDVESAKATGSKFPNLKHLRENSLLPYTESAYMTDKCRMEPVCARMKHREGRFRTVEESAVQTDEPTMSLSDPHRVSEDSELEIVKFFKAVRAESVEQKRSVEQYNMHYARRASMLPYIDETELRNTLLDQQSLNVEPRKWRETSSLSASAQNEPAAGSSGHISKRLRFVEEQGEQDHEEEEHEHGKDVTRSFWGIGKPKVSTKKKTTLPFLSPR